MTKLSALTIRGIDAETLRWIRHRAADHGQSMSAELLDLLEVARADEMADKAGDNPFATGFREARKRGIRTPATSAGAVRSLRDRVK